MRKNTTAQQEMRIAFHSGTLQIHTQKKTALEDLAPFLLWDKRLSAYRCAAQCYRPLIEALRACNWGYADHCRNYERLSLFWRKKFLPFPYQEHACSAWNREKRGIIVLPTGAGKSFVALMLIEQLRRSTLVMVPTLELLRQWRGVLAESFGQEIGQLGDGLQKLLPITVATYDSARIQAQHIGNRFGFIVFDECHHLTSEGHVAMAQCYIAPYRLGLTATPPTDTEKIYTLEGVVGRTAFQVDIGSLSGSHLAPYILKTIYVSLNQHERESYEYNRSIYLDFRRQAQIAIGSSRDWEQFVFFANRSVAGRKALQSFAEQKRIATAASAKLLELERIILQHKDSRILIFTHDNSTAYRISITFLLPLITHETKKPEREKILSNFREGHWPYLVSSRVLNEGVDIPEANVAVIISGTSTVREHVQRLGRILRKNKGKRAILYEIVAEGTGEVLASQKRREHEAYKR